MGDRDGKPPLSDAERAQLTRSVTTLGIRAADATDRTIATVASWRKSDFFRGGTIVDHRVKGVQSLNLLLVSGPDIRTDVSESLAEVVSAVRIAHDRIGAAKRRGLTLSESFPLADHPWPLIRALDNLQKHQLAPRLHWFASKVQVDVFDATRTRQLGSLNATPSLLPLAEKHVDGDHIRLVDEIPREFRGVNVAYRTSVLELQLMIAPTRDHPHEYELIPTLGEILATTPALVAMTQAS